MLVVGVSLGLREGQLEKSICGSPVLRAAVNSEGCCQGEHSWAVSKARKDK